jgi:hypothetical protein
VLALATAAFRSGTWAPYVSRTDFPAEFQPDAAKDQHADDALADVVRQRHPTHRRACIAGTERQDRDRLQQRLRGTLALSKLRA